jgi:hypothetical protein
VSQQYARQLPTCAVPSGEAAVTQPKPGAQSSADWHVTPSPDVPYASHVAAATSVEPIGRRR